MGEGIGRTDETSGVNVNGFPATNAFGAPTITVRLLEFDRPWRHPWLTVPVAEQEIAQQDYEGDREQVFMASIGEAA